MTEAGRDLVDAHRSNYLVHELDRPDPEIDKLWIKEAARREKEMKSGKVKILTHEEVFGKYRR